MTTQKKPSLLLFDVNETLLDMQPVKNAINEHFGKEYAAQLWFSYLLQYSMVELVTKQYHNFSEVADAVLEMVAHALKLQISPDKKKEILSLMAQLNPHPDVEEGLQLLQEKGYRLATLTNSAQKVADQQLAHAGIDHYFEASMSVEPMQLFKPTLDTYYRALKQLEVAPEDCLFVAAHGWDTAGAMRAGLTTAFIAREGKALYPLAPTPDYTGSTLPEIARQLPS